MWWNWGVKDVQSKYMLGKIDICFCLILVRVNEMLQKSSCLGLKLPKAADAGTELLLIYLS